MIPFFYRSLCLIILSGAIIAFGQPARWGALGLVGAFCGFALFWRALFFFSQRKSRFFLSMGWFALVQAVQLSWMTSTQYMGPLILVVYLFLLLALGAQFGLLSLWLPKEGKEISARHLFAMAGCWAWLEWVRLFFMSGFSWNLVGLQLAASPLAIQWASLGGVFLLSFWVIWVNGLALWAWFGKRRHWALFGAMALAPYLFGALQKEWALWLYPPEATLRVALVQTGLDPEQKEAWDRNPKDFLPPLARWEKIASQLKGHPLDLVVFPEGAFPYSAKSLRYPREAVAAVWREVFSEEIGGEGKTPFSNQAIAQELARTLKTDVVIGFDDFERSIRKSYNAAFWFSPRGEKFERYEKRVLVPVGEYIPFQKLGFFNEFLAKEFGIYDSFLAGSEAKIFPALLPIGASICYEETFPFYSRELRLKGAKLLVNLSNDAWFPRSKLPEQHLDHGRVRAAENGVPLLRACNRGVSGAIDSFGTPLALLSSNEEEVQEAVKILFFSLPVQTYPTLYSWWGDALILSLSLLGIVLRLFSLKSCPK